MTGEVVEVPQKGLQGYNKFIKKMPGATSTEGLPNGMKYQQRAGELFQLNKINQGTVKDAERAGNILNIIYELNKGSKR